MIRETISSLEWPPQIRVILNEDEALVHEQIDSLMMEYY